MFFAAVMLFTAAVPNIRASADGGADVYEAAAQCLSELGGAEYTAETDLGAEMTRGEFCGIVTKYFGIMPVSGSQTTPFIDVEPSHEYFDEIRTLYDMGYISGDENRHFYPDRAITVREAATVIVTALGYKYEAMMNGGWPTGFTSVAVSRGMLTESFENFEVNMTRGNIYKMLFDCLEVPVVTVEGSAGNTAHVTSDENTVLWVYFKAVKDEGLVTANEYTSLTSPEGAADGRIAIDDTEYTAAADANDMIGLNAVYYISYKNDDNGEIVSIYERNNKITEIDSGNIESVSPGGVEYMPEGEQRLRTAKLDDDADILWNGKAYTGYGTLEDVMPKNGTVRLIDNDNDGAAEVIDVTDYENYYISALDKSNRIVYDYGESRNISLGNSEDTIEIYGADGARTTFSTLKTGAVLSVAKSRGEGGRLIRAYVSEAAAEGTVDSASDDGYTIGGTQYKKAPDMTREITAGMQGVFYLDITGKIAAYGTSVDTSYNYAVVYSSVYDENESIHYLTLFTHDEKFTQYTINGKIVFNGHSASPYEDADEFAEKLKAGSVIRYKLSDDGSGMGVIETPLAMVEDAGGNKSPADSEDFRTLYEGSSFKYRNGMLDGKLIIDDETVIFSIPKTENWSDKTLFGTLTTGSFSGGSSYSKNYKAYAIGENAVNDADVMVIEDMTKGSIGNNTNMVLVTGLGSGVTTDGEVCTIIEGAAAGNTVEYYCTEDTLIEENGLARGDIIRVGLDSTNTVKSIQKIYNADGSASFGSLLAPNDGVCENTASFDSEFRVAIGTVLDKNNAYMKFEMQKKSGDEFYGDTALCQISEATVVKFNGADAYSVPTPCSINDIIEGDTVIIRMRLASAREIIILR